jgi:hypothetical protein
MFARRFPSPAGYCASQLGIFKNDNCSFSNQASAPEETAQH